MKRVVLFCTCLLIPHTVAADAIVKWQADGEIGFSSFAGQQGTGMVPPAGTPYQLTMTLSPGSMTRTALSPAGANCFQVSVNAALTLGGFNYALGGLGFTHAQLSESNCLPGSPETQFIMGFSDLPAGNPWPVLEFGFMELWFTDLIQQDGFPDSPTHTDGGFQIRDQVGSFSIRAAHNLHGVPVEQPAAVPEPGTLTLFGLGLAAVARKVRRSRRTPR